MKGQKRGEEHWKSKLTEKQVLEIAADPGRYKVVGYKHMVSEWAVSDIKNGRTWAWLTGIKRKGAGK